MYTYIVIERNRSVCKHIHITNVAVHSLDLSFKHGETTALLKVWKLTLCIWSVASRNVFTLLALTWPRAFLHVPQSQQERPLASG